MNAERLHKVMAGAGVASRRECEAMIAAGRVTVNGKVVTAMGVKVDPQRDVITVDGERLKVKLQPTHTYLMLYKPVGYLSVFNDERGRPGLEKLVQTKARLYPVGRLDADSEGLLLLTDDGDLTLRLSHPRYEHAKTYLVLVDRRPGTDILAHFRRGIQLEDGVTASSDWRVLDARPHVPAPSDPEAAEGVWLQVTLGEGRKRQLRRMAAAEKLHVRRLVRVAIGPLQLDRGLQPGESRPLSKRELQMLRAAGGRKPTAGARQPPGTADRRRKITRRGAGAAVATGSQRSRRRPTAESPPGRSGSPPPAPGRRSPNASAAPGGARRPGSTGRSSSESRPSQGKGRPSVRPSAKPSRGKGRKP